MKRILIALSALILSLISCSKYDGTDYYSSQPSTTSSPLKEYMTCITNDIVAGCLTEIESAIAMDQEGSLSKYFYDTNGKSILTDGSVWTLRREGVLNGAVISKVAGETAWTVDYNGDFEFTGYKYPTRFHLKATAADATATGHRDWKVELSGLRTEEEGYRCSFESIEKAIDYVVVESVESSWNAYGYMKMVVLKGETTVDTVIMELRGGISTIAITHI